MHMNTLFLLDNSHLFICKYSSTLNKSLSLLGIIAIINSEVLFISIVAILNIVHECNVRPILIGAHGRYVHY